MTRLKGIETLRHPNFSVKSLMVIGAAWKAVRPADTRLGFDTS
ncbi:hypothetical protein [Pseudomonas phage Astolliot]|nr:hypothetical protein [Pseudomonas phage Astolliot]